MITTKIIFDRKHQAKKDGTGTIEVRVTIARRTIYISTGVRVREREWKAGMVVNRTDAPALNERLAIIYEIVEREANRCIKDGEAISTEKLKAKVWPVKEAMDDDSKFIDWVKDQIKVLTISPGTRKQYKTMLTRLTEFDKMKRWSDVTAENITLFDSWLHQRKKKDGTSIIDAAVYKYHRCLKALINRAVTFQKIERNPYDLLKGKFKRGDRENVEYLTESEMVESAARFGCGVSFGRLYANMGVDIGATEHEWYNYDTGFYASDASYNTFFMTIGFNWAGDR